MLSVFKNINFKDSVSSITPCDVLLFCHDADRGVTLDQLPYSPLMDSLGDELKARGYCCQSVSLPWSKLTGSLAHNHPIAFNRRYFWALLQNKFLKQPGQRPLVSLYEKILTLARPKLVITIGCENALCEAAHRLKVFHVELLHGIGYAKIRWGWDAKDPLHLPQGILSLDAVSTQAFSALQAKGVEVKEIPHPFLRRFQSDNVHSLPNEWLPNETKHKSYKKEILISLQWGYFGDHGESDFYSGVLKNGLFYDELENLIQKTEHEVFWRFRFHPVQLRQPAKYQKLFDFMDHFVQKHGNCDWRESSHLPLPSLLRHCSGHITMNSMTSYEAAYFGLPTLALCPTVRAGGHFESFFNDLVETGYLTKQVFDEQAVAEWIDQVEKKPPKLNNLGADDAFDDAVDWLLSRSGLIQMGKTRHVAASV